MDTKTLAENLYETALKAQWVRMNPKEPVCADARKVGCKFNDLFDNSKLHYFAMAEWVLNNKNLL